MPRAAPTSEPSAPPRSGRFRHTATALTDGSVLVVGGSSETRELSPFRVSAPEWLPPDGGAWQAGVILTVAPAFHTATLLRDGTVLVAGGAASYERALAEVWRFEPGARRWRAASPMPVARFDHTATLLSDGSVLVVGGQRGAGCGPGCPIDCYDDEDCPGGSVCADGFFCAEPLDTVERYDPDADVWSVVGRMSAPRVGHAVALLPDGRALITGGRSAQGELASTELFDPSKGSLAPGPRFDHARRDHTLTILADGSALAVGGRQAARSVGGAVDSDGAPGDLEGVTVQAPLAEVELLAPGAGRWTPVARLRRARFDHTATLLSDGSVLVWGGAGERHRAVPGGERRGRDGRWVLLTP